MRQSRGPSVFIVTLTITALATVFVCVRLVSRIGVVKRVTADDYFIILAWLISLGICFCISYGVKYGLGTHQSSISEPDAAILNRLEYSFSVLYNPALMATKTSILIFYLTLSKTQRVFRWTTMGTLFVVISAGLALTLLNVFQCHPITSLFKQPIPAGSSCVDIISLYLSSSPANILTDLMILLLPLPVLKGMRLPKKQKLILYFTFSAGIFVTIVDVIRIVYLQDAMVSRFTSFNQGVPSQDNNLTSQDRQADFAWNISLSYMWSAVEVNVGIMCACVPGIKPLIARYLPRVLKDDSSGVNSRISLASVQDELSSPQAHAPSLAADQIWEFAHPFRRDSTRDCRIAQPPPTALSPTSIISPTRAEEPSRNELREHLPKLRTYNSSSSKEMGMVDFLSSPHSRRRPTLDRRSTIMTNATINTETGNDAFFDFINMDPLKSIVHMSGRESIRPIAETTVLFFMWGFAYGLLNSLNSDFQQSAQLTVGQTIAIHSVYYVGYFVGPLSVGRWALKNWGFKSCYVIGLIIYGTGALVFWPSAVLSSFGGFFVSNLIVGFGLSILETAANPFIVLCGPASYGAVRLNISQGVQAIGTVLSQLLANKILFKGASSDAPTLINTQWTYLAITLFSFLLAFVYYVLKIPEVTDDELEELCEQCHNGRLTWLRESNTVWYTLALAIFAQFLYVGGQLCVANTLQPYLSYSQPSANFNNFETMCHALFAISRFTAAFLALFIKPRHVLGFFLVGQVIFSGLAMDFTGLSSSAMVMCIFFFQGPIFPLVFAIPLHSMGRYTKDASALLAASISGGAAFAPIQHVVHGARGVKYSYSIVLAIAAFTLIFPIYLNLWRGARVQTDAVHSAEARRSSSTASSYSHAHSKILNSLHRRRSSTPSSAHKRAKAEHIEEYVAKEPRRWPSHDSLTFETSALESL